MMEVRMNMNDDDIWSCLVGAFEGGSGYWARTCVTDRAGLTYVRHDDPRITEENERRAAERPNGFLPYGERCTDDMTWLRENNIVLYSSMVPFLGGEITVYDSESINFDTGEYEVVLGVLNRETMERGLQLMQDNSPRHFNNLVTGNHDAITSDVMMQYMVMGEVVFG